MRDLKFNINLLVVLVLCLSIHSCALDVGYEEVQRDTSPNEKYDAVVIQVNGGATVAFAYDIYLVRKGLIVKPDLKASANQVKVAHIYAAALNERRAGLNIRWVGSKKLEIEYETCRFGTIYPLVKFDGQQFETIAYAGVNFPTPYEPNSHIQKTIENSNTIIKSQLKYWRF